MTNDEYNFNDPRLLFKLWKEFTGEDLTISKAPKKEKKIKKKRRKK